MVKVNILIALCSATTWMYFSNDVPACIVCLSMGVIIGWNISLLAHRLYIESLKRVNEINDEIIALKDKTIEHQQQMIDGESWKYN